MGKVKAWVMDLEEQFIDKCAEIAEESECYMEYCERAVLNDKLVLHWSCQEVADCLNEIWYEVWSEYNV